MRDLPESYQEHVWYEPSVCRNCCALYRRPEPDLRPATERDKMNHEVEVIQEDTHEQIERDLRVGTHYKANDEHVDPGWHPADSPGFRYSRKFCECGAPNAFTILWDDADVDRDRFRDLCRNLIQSLAFHGLQFDDYDLARHAFDRFISRVEPYQPTDGVRPAITPATDHAVHAALGYGLEQALRLHTARGGASRSRSPAD